MKKLIIILLAIVSLNSCDFLKKGTEIKGTLEGGANQYIYIIDITPVNAKPDSILISEKGTFKFFIETTEPKDYILYSSQSNFARVITEPFDKIHITGNYGNLNETYEIQGSKVNDDIKMLNEHLVQNLNILDSLNGVYNQFKDSSNIDTIILKLNDRSKEVYENEKEFLTNFIKNNPSSLASYYALAQKFNRNTTVLKPEQDFEYFKMVDTALQRKYPNSAISNQIHSFIVQIEARKKQQEAQQGGIGIGEEAPEISLQNPEGETINLSDYRGKYVLLDFWAAWCKPCRAENPNLVQQYRIYKNKGFEIFQVSLDREKEAWVNAIKADRLNWTHVSDLGYWNSAPAKLYNVRSIPASFLLDKEGKVIAINLRGEALGQKLKEIFENPQLQ